jgi:hypothetical protein
MTSISTLIDKIGGAMIALLRTLACCWIIGVVFVAVMYVLAANDQGRETLLATAQTTPAVLVLIFSFVALMTAHCLARLRVDHDPKARFDFNTVLARDAAPLLAALAAGFALPVWLDSRGGAALNDDVGTRNLSILLIVVALTCVVYARIEDMLLSKEPPPLGEYPVLLAGPLLVGAASVLALACGVDAKLSALLAAVCAIGGSILSARYECRTNTKPWPTFSTTAGIGMFWAAIGWIAAWNHANNPLVAIGTEAGPFLTLFLALGGWLGFAFFWVLILELIGRVERRRLRYWLSAGCFMGATILVGAALTGTYNRAAVHPVTDTAEGVSLDEHIARWIDQRRSDIERARPYRTVFVSAEGGGVRAGYWTATVLASLHDRVPDFSDHVFAVSGVSGGSVGASVYAALVHRSLTSTTLGTDARPCANLAVLESCAARVLGTDLLSAPLLGTLFGDVLRSTFRSDRWPDRGRVLDEILERAWQDATGSNQMRLPFYRLWSDARVAARVPLLTPNATSVSDGKRAVLMPVTVVAQEAESAHLTLDGRKLSLATATLLSARFLSSALQRISSNPNMGTSSLMAAIPTTPALPRRSN